MGAADATGLVVSYIQSLYWEFGSGCVLPRTGVLMQNRGASFSLDAKALNVLAPGRLPFHTLNPALAVLEGRPRHGLRHHGRRRPAADRRPPSSPATSCSACRSTRRSTRRAGCSGRTWGSTHHQSAHGSRFDGNLVDRLLSAGHDVEVLAEAYSDTMGHAGAVVLHPDGTLEGGHDPRADGGAAGRVTPRSLAFAALLAVIRLRRSSMSKAPRRMICAHCISRIAAFAASSLRAARARIRMSG